MFTFGALCLTGLAGCRTLNEEISKQLYSSLYTSGQKATMGWSRTSKYELTGEKLRQNTFEGTVKVGDVNACYQAGLREQSLYIANQLNDLITFIEQSTALELSTTVNLYLLRLNNIPDSYQMTFIEDPNTYIVPLFVTADNESCKTIISENPIYPYSLIHELTEMSLMLRKPNGVVLGDVECLGYKAVNYTRWFREGLANYAGLLAQNRISCDINCINEQTCTQFIDPFSSLDYLGDELFSWHNYQNMGQDDTFRHYSAALGLFLLIRQDFGPEAIKKIVTKTKDYDYLDGQDLIKIINEVLKTNLRKLVEDFKFPETGLKATPLTPATILNEGIGIKEGLFVVSVEPNSAAEKAQIKKNDVIVSINGKSLKYGIDLELAIFESRGKDSTEITVWQKDKGLITKTFQLDWSYSRRGKLK